MRSLRFVSRCQRARLKGPIRTAGGSAGMSSIGIVAASFVVGAVMVFSIAALVHVLGPDWVAIIDAEPGDCLVMPIDATATEIEAVERVGCDEPHDAEVIAAGALNPNEDAEYPDDDTLFALVDRACGDPSRLVDLGFGVLPVAPNELAWNGRNGRYVCLAVTVGPNKVTGRRTPVDFVGAESATA